MNASGLGRIARQLALSLCGLSLVAGCYGGDDPTRSIAGQWCSVRAGSAEECATSEALLVEFYESEGAISGKNCEAHDDDCSVFDGVIRGSHVTYWYEFSKYWVNADLMLTSDGESLTGTYASDMCNCAVPVTLHRL